MCTCDHTALSRFLEYLSKVALQPMTDLELREFESSLDLSALEVPAEQQFRSEQRPSDICAASPGHSVGALPVEEIAEPSGLR